MKGARPLLLSMLVLCSGLKGLGAVYTVNLLTDTGSGSGNSGDLRYCITQANTNPGADEIGFAVTGTIALNSGLPNISDSLFINGIYSGITVDGQNHSGTTVFRVNSGPGVTVTIIGLSVVRGNGNNPDGGGILLRGGASLNLINVTVDHCTTLAESGGGIVASASSLNIAGSRITNNHLTAPGGSGAGIFVEGGTLAMRDTTVSGNSLMNSTDIGGAGIELFSVSLARIENSTINGNVNGNYGAGIRNNMGTLRMSNVTVDGNTGGVQAGGLGNIGGNATLRNCTISGNSVTRFGGGIYNVGNGAVLTLANTIVAGNTSGIQAPDIFNFATINGLGKNIVSVQITNSGTINGADTFLNVDPQMMPLTNYGGSVWTRALAPLSPGRNIAVNAEALDTLGQPLETDARGIGFPRIIEATVDIGAFESSAVMSAYTISGRVLRGARVILGLPFVKLTDLGSGGERVRPVNHSGHFRFPDVPSGTTVRVEATGKGRTFLPQTVTVAGDIGNLIYIPQP